MTERQIHGFKYEDYIKNRYNLKNYENSYTSKWDALYKDIPVSIKTHKIGSVELGDYFRQASVSEDFLMFIGFWDNSKTKDIVEEHILFIPHKKWNECFSNNVSEYLKHMLDNITNKYEDDAKWKSMMNEANSLWEKHTNKRIKPLYKRDHKSQKRIQCGISKSNMYSYFIPNFEIKEDFFEWGDKK